MGPLTRVRGPTNLAIVHGVAESDTSEHSRAMQPKNNCDYQTGQINFTVLLKKSLNINAHCVFFFFFQEKQRN